MFNVVNLRTGLVVGTYSTKQRARNARDRKDSEYGACAHYIVQVAA